MAEALVNRILAPSFLDGPGSRMAIFLQGCDLACVHCHNPETWMACRGCAQCVPVCPSGALQIRQGALDFAPTRCQACDQCLEACPWHASPRARSLTVEAVLEEARPWKPFLDGVTFSGGECTLQWPFLLECLPRLQSELGLPTLLDTNGNMEAEVLESLLGVTQGFLFDLKALDSATHRRITGQGNERILANLSRATAARKVTEIRTVLLPGITDDPESALEVARFVKALDPAIPLRLSPFRPQGVRGPWADVPALAPEVFQACFERAREELGKRAIRAGMPSPDISAQGEP